MFNKIVRTLWGDLQGEELKKFLLLALGFFFIIGSFWPLKTLKDSIFITMVGPEYIQMVKLLSLLIFFPLILGYSKLIDIFSKQKMIYFLSATYGTIGLIFVYFFYHPSIGLQNSSIDPSRLLGWFFFLYVESYISLILQSYWAFVNDITTPESAKKGYGLIIFGTQLGGFLTTLLGNRLSADASMYASRGPLIILISVVMIFFIGIVTLILHHVVAIEDLQSYQEKMHIDVAKKAAVGFFEGLRVVFVNPYVISIFGIIFFHEIISTVMNFQMLFIVKATYIEPGMVNKFLFDYALAVQGIACLFGLVGTSFFQRRFGIRFCIVTYPLLLGASIFLYLLYPSLQTIFYVMLIAKAINYAFNQPAKEVLYIPLAREIKYKSKAWVDMFGMRFSKASGAVVSKAMGPLTGCSGCIIFGFIGLWALLANTLGKKFHTATSNNKLIE